MGTPKCLYIHRIGDYYAQIIYRYLCKKERNAKHPPVKISSTQTSRPYRQLPLNLFVFLAIVHVLLSSDGKDLLEL